MILPLKNQSKERSSLMHKQWAIGLAVGLAVLLCYNGRSFAETPLFDPEQPFKQAFGSKMLRDIMNRTLDLIEDHIEVGGDVGPKDPSGDQQGRFSLKLYPKGKSQSGEHVAAEGWFRLSPDRGRQDFHLRFERPQEPSQRPSPPQGEML
jgi:hypothetical protein